MISNEELDRRFDDGEDVSEYFDSSTTRFANGIEERIALVVSKLKPKLREVALNQINSLLELQEGA